MDEFGPLNLQPRAGKGWYPHKQPKRLRATYTRPAGVRHMFAALDLATGEMFYRFRDRKRWREFLGFLKQLRRRFPTGRLYLVCDNYGSHQKAEVAQEQAIGRYLRWRNKYAQPKRHFAIGSKIRQPDYLPLSA